MQDIEFDYRHDFAVWAGARASQRGFTTVKLLKEALELSGVKEFSRNPSLVTSSSEFNNRHGVWCNRVCDLLEDNNVKGVTFGRAAKLIAVYLKVMLVMPNIDSTQAHFIHPPIDRILLQNLSKIGPISMDNKRLFRQSNWTKFDQDEYLEVLNAIRSFLNGKPMWRIEEYWAVTAEK